MSKRPRSFSKEFKAKVALAVLQEPASLQELTRGDELHPNQIIPDLSREAAATFRVV